MGRDFTEVPLAGSLHLRIEPATNRKLGDYLSLRPETCLTPFPLYGNLYHILTEQTLENPAEDIVTILNAQRQLYQNFGEGARVFGDANETSTQSERAQKEIERQAKRIFFKNQLTRLSNVETALDERIDHYERNNWNRPNEAFDYSKVFSEVQAAVVSFHRDVLAASYAFDRISIVLRIKPEEKFGEEPYVCNPLEKALVQLELLSSNKEKISVSRKRKEWREKQLADILSDISKTAEQIVVAFKDLYQ